MLVGVNLCPIASQAPSTVRVKDSRSQRCDILLLGDDRHYVSVLKRRRPRGASASSPRLTNTSRELKIDHTLANSGGVFPEIELDQAVLGLRDSHRTSLYLRLIGLRPVPIRRTRNLCWLVEAGVLMHLH